MSFCEKCIHYEMCEWHENLIPDTIVTFFPHNEDCPLFKNKADFVEVVRCKNCKHYHSYGRTSLLVDGKNIKAGWCQRRMRYDEEHRMLPTDFCSYGEPKDGLTKIEHNSLCETETCVGRSDT